MNTLIGLVGLPRSGKSTYAKTLIAQGAVVVNPDSVRFNLTGQSYAKEAEKFVWAIVELMVKHNFAVGHTTVVLDATNVSKTRRAWWIQQSWLTQWHIIGTPADVCIARAADNTALIDVIKFMASIYNAPTADEGKIITV